MIKPFLNPTHAQDPSWALRKESEKSPQKPSVQKERKSYLLDTDRKTRIGSEAA